LESLIGQPFDRFQLASVISSGRDWMVYNAYDPKFERQVTIKVLQGDLADHADAKDGILRSARSGIRLRHPGIARMWDLGQVGSLFYLVTELIPGVDLGRLLEEMRRSNLKVGITEAVLIAREIALAVDHARQRGFRVSDLRTSDIMLKLHPSDVHLPSGRVVLPYQPVIVDLGLASTAREQINGIDNFTGNEFKGIVSLLYELVTGFPPDSKPGPNRRSLPASLQKLMRRAYSKEDGQLFSSPTELADALDAMTPGLMQSDTEAVQLHGITPLFAVHQQHIALNPLELPLPIADEKPEMEGSESDQAEMRLRVLHADHSVRFIPVRMGTITIGRGQGNDIVLLQADVSRQHTQINYDGSQFKVTDLGSSNGTFIGDQRLLAHVPQVWPPGEMLRIGDSFIQIETPKLAEDQRLTQALVSSEGQTIGLPAAVMKVDEGAVGLAVDRVNLTVHPGQKAVLVVGLSNLGLIEDLFTLIVAGVPDSWLKAPSELMRLAAGEQRITQIEITPPRTPDVKAGRKSIIVSAKCAAAPNRPAEARLNLSVAEFEDYRWSIQPAQIKAGNRIQVRLENLGNTNQTYQVACFDSKNMLHPNPPAARLVVPPGQGSFAQFQIHSRSTPLFGKETPQSLSVRLEMPGKPSDVKSITVSVKPLLPMWAMWSGGGAVLLAGLFGLLLISGLIFGNMAGGRSTFEAMTELEQMVAMTEQARLETEQSLAGANIETIQAVTATAAWLDLDDDRDGLTNRMELELGTSPQERDTDQDGLSDGDEVNRGLNPLEPDTDSDSLMDGDEVARGLNPLDRDTDKDGIPDGIDPDPGKVPTATIMPTGLPSLTPTLAPFTATSTLPFTPTSTQPVVGAPPPNPVPSISGLTPSGLPVGSPGQPITINGSGFVDGAQVFYNNSQRSILSLTSNTITIALLAPDLATAGSFSVRVTNPSPGGGDSSNAQFLVSNPKPEIISLTPSSATVGQSLTELIINGTGFNDGTKVFSTVDASSSQRTVTSRTPTMLIVSLTSADLNLGRTITFSVANDPPLGGSDAETFTVNNPDPILNSLDPDSTTVSSEELTIDLTGDNFVPNSKAYWAEDDVETELETTYNSPQSLQANVPGSELGEARTVQIRVKNPAPAGGTSDDVDFDIIDEEEVGYYFRRRENLMI
jgi:pSer/pThr/pTyr-binding forkhead associated (FHA) protein